MSNVNVIGIDLAKNVFQLHAADKQGNKVFVKRLKRIEVLSFLAQQPNCLVAMEACGGSHYWAREIKALGHTVKMMSAKYVKPFVGNQKNDMRDAQAIAEAAIRKTIPAVSVKSVEMQELQFLHRIRSRHVKMRTMLSNQLRGILLEYGVAIKPGMAHLKRGIPDAIEDASNEITTRMRHEIQDLFHELLSHYAKVIEYDKKLKTLAKESRACQLIMDIAGISHITATAVLTELGDPRVYKNGRHFAAFLGLVPKQYSSGEKTRLGGITKHGDSYIRSLLIHGARSVTSRVDKKEDRLSKRIKRIKYDACFNKAAVALANRNARVIWHLIANNEEYIRNV